MVATPTQEEQQWRLTVTGQLATLIAETAGLKTQVTRQNGNVAKLWEHVDAAERLIATLDKRTASDRAAREAAAEATHRTSRAWESWVRPALMAVLTFVLGLAARGVWELARAVAK